MMGLVFFNDLSVMVFGTEFAISLNMILKWEKSPSHHLSSSGGFKIPSPTWYPLLSRRTLVKTEDIRSSRMHQNLSCFLKEWGPDEETMCLVFLQCQMSRTTNHATPECWIQWAKKSQGHLSQIRAALALPAHDIGKEDIELGGLPPCFVGLSPPPQLHPNSCPNHFVLVIHMSYFFFWNNAP